MTEGRERTDGKKCGQTNSQKRKEGRIEEHADVDRQWDRQTGELNRQKETDRRSKLARYNGRQKKGRAEGRMAK